MLDPTIKRHKKQFDRDLRHIKLILSHARHELPVKEWLALVEETKQSVLTCRDDFFCHDLPADRLFRTAIEKVFDAFLEGQRLLALQTCRPFKR